MKNIVNLTLVFVIALAALPNCLSAQVSFTEGGEWQSILEKAGAQDKLIFVDAYTEWCSWCKVMDKKTFSQAEVGEFMNSRMMSYKIEMEKTELGRKLSMKYGINSFPTFLIFKPTGELAYKLTGFQEPVQFIENLNKAVMIENQLIQPGYSQELDLDYPDIYLQVYPESGKKVFPDSLAVEEYIMLQPDYSNEVTWQVIKRFGSKLSQERRELIHQQKEALVMSFGESEYEDYVERLISADLGRAIKSKDADQLEQTLDFARQNLSDPDKSIPYYRLAFASATDDWKTVVRMIDEKSANGEELSASFYNSYGWNIYEKCSDLKIVAHAAGWLTPLVNDETEWHILDTYAALLYKSQNYDEAEKWAIKAIDKGKAEEAKVGETETLLSKIREERKALEK